MDLLGYNEVGGGLDGGGWRMGNKIGMRGMYMSMCLLLVERDSGVVLLVRYGGIRLLIL